MEALNDTPLLKFNPTTLHDVRKEFNLHQDGVLKQVIIDFENWIHKQNHFTKKEFNKHYLETSIIMAKGSLERAKNTLDKLCTLKTLLPQFFSKHDAKKELTDSTRFILQGIMPTLLKDNYRLHVIILVSSDFNSETMFNFHRLSILIAEYIKYNDYLHGYTCIVDCRDANLINFSTTIDIVDLRHCMSVLIEGYNIRVKAVHLISESKGIDIFVGLLRQVLSKKIVNRIHVHKTLESLYEHIPREALPVDYGGDEKPLKEIHEHWVNILSTNENVELLKEILTAGTDEKYRLTEKYNDQILGMPGSFRTLVVD